MIGIYVSVLKKIRLSDDGSYRVSQWHRNSYNPCEPRTKETLFISLNAVSCFFKHLYWCEIDTLPVFMQCFFLIDFWNLTTSPLAKFSSLWHTVMIVCDRTSSCCRSHGSCTFYTQRQHTNSWHATHSVLVLFFTIFPYEISLNECCHIWRSARSCGDCIWSLYAANRIWTLFLKYSWCR